MAYKYFVKTDQKEETVGTINAPSDKMAIRLAARKKQLSVKEFMKIFKVKKITNGK